MPHLELEAVSKTYRARKSEVEALRDVTVDVRSEEFLSIVGPSGCGKSTLLRIVAGLIPASSGQIRYPASCLRDGAPAVGLVFQTPVLQPWRRVLANVTLPARLAAWPTSAARRAAMELLELMGLIGFEDKYPHQLSGGMQQRVAICRALICDPPLLLMDEPFGALDAITRERLNVELVDIWTRSPKTVIFVTHSVEEAVLLSDRIAVMSARPGRISNVIPVDIERPRNQTTIMDSSFVSLAAEVRSEINRVLLDD